MTSEGQESKWHVGVQAMHHKCCKKAKVDESYTSHPPLLALKFKVPHLFSDHLVMYATDTLTDLSRITHAPLSQTRYGFRYGFRKKLHGHPVALSFSP